MRKLLAVILIINICLVRDVMGLAPALVSDPDINAERSDDIRAEMIRKAEPGAIGNGRPLRTLYQGDLSECYDIPLTLSSNAREVVPKIRLATELAIKAALHNRKHVPECHTERFNDTLETLLDFHANLEYRLFLFPAIVEGPEDYLLGFNFHGRIGLALGLVNRLDSISPKLLAQYIFHECVSEKPDMERGDHKIIYSEIQAAVFGYDEAITLGREIRRFITSLADPENFTLTDYFDIFKQAGGYAKAHNVNQAFRYYCYAAETARRLGKDPGPALTRAWKIFDIFARLEAGSIGPAARRRLRLELFEASIRNAAGFGSMDAASMLARRANAEFKGRVKALDRIRAAMIDAENGYPDKAHEEIEFDTWQDEPLRALFHMKSRVGITRAVQDLIRLAMVYDNTGRKEEAVAILDAHKHDIDVSEREEGKCFLDVYINLAKMFFDMGNLEGAYWILNTIAELSDKEFTEAGKNTPDIREDMTVREHFHAISHNRAEVLYEMGRFKDAVEDIKTALYFNDRDLETRELFLKIRIRKLMRSDPPNRKVEMFVRHFYFKKRNSDRVAFLRAAKDVGYGKILKALEATAFSTSVKKEKRLLAIDALGEVWDLHAVFRLIESLRENDKAVREHIEGALARIGGAALLSIDYIAGNIDKYPGLSLGVIKMSGRKVRESIDAGKQTNELVFGVVEERLRITSPAHMQFRVAAMVNLLKKAIKDNPGRKFVVAIDTDIGNIQHGLTMPIYKMLDELKNITGAGGRPLALSFDVVRGKPDELVGKIKEKTDNFRDVFVIADYANYASDAYRLLDHKSWIACIDSSQADSFNYLPVFESFLLMLMGHTAADLDVIKDLYEEITSYPVTDDSIKQALDNRLFYILPKAAAFTGEDLRRVNERIRECLAYA